jgi:dipeptidyl aminopeptidase/acylaminoacyl peptidase
MAISKSLKPVAPEDFYSISHVHDPQVHPQGDLIAYVQETPQREGRSYLRSIWLVNRKGRRIRQFTSGGKDGDYSPQWSPDGKSLAFVSCRAGRPQIFLISLEGGEARSFTSLANGASSPVWSPDGKSIAFLSRTSEDERRQEDAPGRKSGEFLDERAQKLREDEIKYQEELRIEPRVCSRTIIKQDTYFKDGRTAQIYVQKASGGKPKRITNGDHDFGPPEWTGDGQFVISSAKLVGDVDIVVRSDLVKIPVQGGDPVALTDDENGNFSPRVSPDGKWIYYLSFQGSELFKQRMKLRRLPVDGGHFEELLSGFDYDVYAFEFDPAGERIVLNTPLHGSECIQAVGMNGGEPEMILAGPRMLGPFSIRNGTLAYRVEAPDIPSDIFCSDPDGANEKRLTDINKKILKNKALSMPEEVWIDRPDGLRIQGWIMLPHGYRRNKKCPWVVQVHGGPHIMWGYSWWHEFQAMCGKGYGVFYCNPRGSEGYGSEFKGAIHLKWGEKDCEDILAGADLVVSRGLADKKRLYLTGGSFGGFMTAWIVTRDHRFRAAAAQRGVYNLVSMYGASDALTLLEWEFDTLPWRNTEILWDHSPLKYVENVSTPLMIIHSEQDYRVGISEAEELYTALKRLGKEAEFIRYPREGHELSRSGEPKHRVDRINRIIGWFDRHA